MTVNVGKRQLLGALGGAAITWHLGAWPQVLAETRTLIGWLSGSASNVAGPFADDFLGGMRERGYINGRDFNLVSRYAEGIQDRLPALAEEIVSLKPQVIVAAAVNAAVPARAATRWTASASAGQTRNDRRSRCLLLGEKRTSSGRAAMSVMTQ